MLRLQLLNKNQLYEIVKRSYFYNSLKVDDAENVLIQQEKSAYIRYGWIYNQETRFKIQKKYDKKQCILFESFQ